MNDGGFFGIAQPRIPSLARAYLISPLDQAAGCIRGENRDTRCSSIFGGVAHALALAALVSTCRSWVRAGYFGDGFARGRASCGGHRTRRTRKTNRNSVEQGSLYSSGAGDRASKSGYRARWTFGESASDCGQAVVSHV
jgi:hypothetical protein